jgi:hypothetical protein
MYSFPSAEPRTGGVPGQSSPAGIANNGLTKRGPHGMTLPNSNFTPHTGAKKIVVKNLRTGPRLNQDSYFEKVWMQLDAALTAIFDGGKPDVSLEELYKGAENVCRQGRAALLAKKLQERCREHVSGRVRDTLLARAGDGTNLDTLRAVVDAWTTWLARLVRIPRAAHGCRSRTACIFG